MSLHLFVGSKRYSSWSLRPYLALAHTGAKFDTTTILLDRDTTRGEIAKVTPAGRVPVLHHDKRSEVEGGGDPAGFARGAGVLPRGIDTLVIWDSLAICEYVNELFPEAKLWPADRAARARARAVSAEMHSGFAELRKHMAMDIGASRAGQGHTPQALTDARRVQAIWRDMLATSNGPFLFGAFSIADAMFAPVTTRFVTYGVDLDATCRGYVDAIAALPAMQQWARDAAAEPATR